jgi:hypothetical protein
MKNISEKWNGKVIVATAYLVPRFAWMTASIDITIDERVVLRTGGVLKFKGDVPTTFELNGVLHSLKISWGKAKPKSFPIILSIDDREVMRGDVPISNWWLNYWPWLVIVFVCIWLNIR